MKQSLTVATFNINGLMPTFQPLPTDHELLPYAFRHREICKTFEKSDVDIINFQEVFTYANVRLLRKNLPSYSYVSFRPFVFGPRGALVTFSKVPLATMGYASFFGPSVKVNRSKLPRLSLLRSSLKGVLVTQAQGLPLTIINTHLLYNAEFNWGKGGEFYEIQKAQLDHVINVMNKNADPIAGTVIVCGDLNIEAGSELSTYFLDKAKLHDTFASDVSSSFHNEYVTPPGFKKRIDYILTNKSDLFSQPQRIFTEKVQLDDRLVHISDHIGLKVTLSCN